LLQNVFIFFRQRLRLSIKTIHFLVMYYPNLFFFLDFSNVFSFFTRFIVIQFSRYNLRVLLFRSSHIL